MNAWLVIFFAIWTPACFFIGLVLGRGHLLRPGGRRKAE